MDPVLRGERVLYPSQGQQYYTAAQAVPQQIYVAGTMADRVASLQRHVDSHSAGRSQYVQDREVLLCPGGATTGVYYRPTGVAAAAATGQSTDDYRERLQLLMVQQQQQQQQHELLRYCTSNNSGSSRNEATAGHTFASVDTLHQQQQGASWEFQQQLAHEQYRQQMTRDRPHHSLRRIHRQYESNKTSRAAHTQSQEQLLRAQQRLLNAQKREIEEQQQQQRYLLQQNPSWRAEETDCAYIPSNNDTVSRATEDSFSQGTSAAYFSESSPGTENPASPQMMDPIERTPSFATGFEPSEDLAEPPRRISMGADAAGGAAAAALSAKQCVPELKLGTTNVFTQRTVRPVSSVLEQQQRQREQEQHQQQMQERQHQMFVPNGGDSNEAASQPDTQRQCVREAQHTQSSVRLHPQQQQIQAGTEQQEPLAEGGPDAQRVYPLQTPDNATATTRTAATPATTPVSCWPSVRAQYANMTPEEAQAAFLEQRPPDPGEDTLIDLDEQLRQHMLHGPSIPRLNSFISVMSPSERVAAMGYEFGTGPIADSTGPFGGMKQQQQQFSMLHPKGKVRVIPYDEYMKNYVQKPAETSEGKTTSPSSIQQESQSRHSSKTLRSRPQKKAVIVGCNYHATQPYHLQGSSNDAHLFAHTCVDVLGFEPQNICLLCDHLPSSCYRKETETGDGATEQQGNTGGSNSTATLQFDNMGHRKTPQEQHANSISLWNEQRSRSAGELLLQGNVKKAAAAAAESATAGIANFWGGISDTGARAMNGGRDLAPVVHSIVDVEKVEDAQMNGNVRELPSRQNILKALNWLVRDAKPDDHLIFFYSGHSVQVDNMAGWEGEGYEEAIVPCDFDMQDIREGLNSSLLTMVQLRQMLLSVPERAHLTIVLDCCGGQTILDPTGTLSPWTFIRGVKQKGLWPLVTDATDKMHRAVYRKEVWADPDMQKQLVRPRYMPGVEVQSVAALVDPLYESPVTCQQTFMYKAFCFAAAPWGTCGIEAVFPSIAVPRLNASPNSSSSSNRTFSSQGGASVIHGVFTWSFVSALIDTLKDPLPTNQACSRLTAQYNEAAAAAPPPHTPLRLVTYKRLLERTRRIVSDLKWNRLFKLDQQPDLTIHTGGGGHINDTFCTVAQQQQRQQQNAVAAARGGVNGGGEDILLKNIQQQQQEEIRGYLSAEGAWQQVIEASLRDFADRKDLTTNPHMPYTATDCYNRAFPTPSMPNSPVSAAVTPASAAAAYAIDLAAAGFPCAGVTPANKPRVRMIPMRNTQPILTPEQLNNINACNAPAYISVLQQQQEQGIPVADTATQLLEQLKQQEKVLQQQLQQQQHQRILHQQSLQQEEQRLQQQLQEDEQRLEELRQQQHAQMEKHIKQQMAQWQRKQLKQHQQLQQDVQEKLQQQRKQEQQQELHEQQHMQMQRQLQQQQRLEEERQIQQQRQLQQQRELKQQQQQMQQRELHQQQLLQQEELQRQHLQQHQLQQQQMQQQQLQQQQLQEQQLQQLQRQQLQEQHPQQQQYLQQQYLQQQQRQQQYLQQQHLQHQYLQQKQVQQQHMEQQQLQQQHVQQMHRLQQQRQCVIARISPAAGEPFLPRDATAVVYV